MYDVNDDAKGDYRRIEILTGPVRRRRWSAEEKARIVEETLAPGARVSEVARRWQFCPQQVFAWRHAAHRECREDAARTDEPVDRGLRADRHRGHGRGSGGGVIEVKLAGAVVRVGSGMDDTYVDRGVSRGTRLGVADMINVPSGARILLATRPVDFRKGAHGLAALASASVGG